MFLSQLLFLCSYLAASWSVNSRIKENNVDNVCAEKLATSFWISLAFSGFLFESENSNQVKNPEVCTSTTNAQVWTSMIQSISACFPPKTHCSSSTLAQCRRTFENNIWNEKFKRHDGLYMVRGDASFLKWQISTVVAKIHKCLCNIAVQQCRHTTHAL